MNVEVDHTRARTPNPNVAMISMDWVTNFSGSENHRLDCVENALNNFIYRLRPRGPGRFGSLEFCTLDDNLLVWSVDFRFADFGSWILDSNRIRGPTR